MIVASHDLDLINEMKIPIVELSKGMIVKEDSSVLPREQ